MVNMAGCVQVVMRMHSINTCETEWMSEMEVNLELKSEIREWKWKTLLGHCTEIREWKVEDPPYYNAMLLVQFQNLHALYTAWAKGKE